MLVNLGFEVLSVRPEKYAAQPTLSFRLKITETTGVSVHSLSLKCQIRIEPQKLLYSQEQQSQLSGLFSDVSRWDSTLKPFLWTHVSTMVPAFEQSTEIELHVPSSYDLEVAAGRYFHVLRGSEVPLVFLFNGMVFAEGGSGLSIQPVSWDCEADYLLPGHIWQEMMDAYFPHSGWLRLDRETLDLLETYKGREALATWDATLRSLLKTAAQEVRG